MTPTPPDKDELSKILDDFFDETPVDGKAPQRYIKDLEQAINRLIAKERLKELKRAIRQGYISAPLRHKVDRRIATLEQSLKEQRNTSKEPREHIHTNIIIDWQYTGDGDHGYGTCGDCGEKLSGFLVTDVDREQRNTSGRSE